MPKSLRFAAFLARRREALRMPQRQVVGRCLITPEAISQFETAHHQPSLDTLHYLAEALAVDRQAFCRFALQSRAPEFYAALGLPSVEQEELEAPRRRTRTENPLVEADDEEKVDSDWTQRADGPAALDVEGSAEPTERPC